MRLLTDLSTQTRLFIVFGLLSLVAASIAALSIINVADFQVQVTDLRAGAQVLDRSRRAQSDLAREQVAIKNALLTDNLEKWTQVYDYGAQFYDFLSSPELYAADEQVNQALDEIDALRAQYDAALDPIYQSTYSSSYDPQAALLRVKEEADPIAAEMQTRLAVLGAQELQRVASQADWIERAVQASANTGRWAILILAGLLVLAMALTNQVSQPLHTLTGAIVAFQNNTYRSEMLTPFLQRRDELGQLAQAIDAMATSITESNRLKDQFLDSASRFIPEQYLEFLEKPTITEVNLGDHVSAEMAVMFSDIRGFTTVSERMSPQENFDFVNEYLKLVSPVIQQHEGFIVKFLGDGMMAIFPYGVDDAVQAGIEKQARVQAFNDLLARRGYDPVTVGIGIHVGHMMVGMIGEERRIQGDAFSDNVNLTSRIEGLNKFYGTSMIVSQDTVDSLEQPASYRMRYLGQAHVKGRQAPLAIYEVYEGLPDEVVARRNATKDDFERGIARYGQGRFAEAQQAFDAVLATDPGDATARYYLERCFEWSERSLPANWDGALVMADK
ncbi:MAG: HAMP domain-containing protein [Anaerolineae bacterium]|nr:HAMP domain-containing protein [Anaerolineae bacterium]